MATILERYGEQFLIAVAFLPLAAPVVHYLLTGWATRRTEILGAFTDDAIRHYFRSFLPARGGVDDDLRGAFARFYDGQFGRRHFILAGGVLLVVAGFMIWLVSHACVSWLKPNVEAGLEVPPVVVAAIVGAYVWVVYDLAARAHHGDLRATNLFQASYRFLFAAPLAIGLTAPLKDQAAVPVAILLGVFPMATLLTTARRLAAKRIDAETGGEPSHELTSLQGIRRDEAERFEEEGISTIVQLAYADPITLTMKTSFAFSYVVDCCSQALAWLYFENDLAKMRRLGLRGAQEISALIDEVDNAEGGSASDRARKCLEIAAAQLNVDPSPFECALRQVAEDPYTEFLRNIWCAGD